MRILFVIQNLGLGGIIRQVSLLASGLQKNGHEVSVLALKTIDGEWVRLWEAQQVRIRTICDSRPWNIFPRAGLVWATYELRRVIKKERIQVVYAFQGHAARFISWLAVSSVPGTKVVWGVRGIIPLKNLEGYTYSVSTSVYLNKWVSPYVPLMISNSLEGLVSRRSLGYVCGREIVIPNGIDTDKFRPDPTARDMVRREWGVPGDARLIGVAARLSPEKGHNVFIEAASMLLKEGRDVRFVCIGDGDENYKKGLQLKSLHLGLGDRILWAGTREDMPSIYNTLDIHCSSSFLEGFPNVIGEAMACGVPCVVTDVGSSALIVGDLGKVVQPGDPAALAVALGGMLDLLPEVRPEDIRNRITENFTVDMMVGKTEEALEELLNG